MIRRLRLKLEFIILNLMALTLIIGSALFGLSLATLIHPIIGVPFAAWVLWLIFEYLELWIDRELWLDP